VKQTKTTKVSKKKGKADKKTTAKVRLNPVPDFQFDEETNVQEDLQDGPEAESSTESIPQTETSHTHSLNLKWVKDENEHDEVFDYADFQPYDVQAYDNIADDYKVNEYIQVPNNHLLHQSCEPQQLVSQVPHATYMTVNTVKASRPFSLQIRCDVASATLPCPFDCHIPFSDPSTIREFKCNEIAEKLAILNPGIIGDDKALVQRAVDVYLVQFEDVTLWPPRRRRAFNSRAGA
jgi:hypothetical protein